MTYDVSDPDFFSTVFVGMPTVSTTKESNTRGIQMTEIRIVSWLWTLDLTESPNKSWSLVKPGTTVRNDFENKTGDLNC